MFDPVAHLWLLNMAAFALLPSAIKLPQYQFGLLFIPERISLFIAILFCAVVGAARQGRGLTRLSALLAVVFFGFMYVDTRAIGQVDADITALNSKGCRRANGWWPHYSTRAAA